ncbi:cache domain-containing protein [uncultured Methanomethylovorans sp.]|uniref:cache domain-containing protein n=1 Tax=uncultured Methanomethylovorans sp. TaxID=183759 RepID=UPI002AA8B109|nr:cache domain-containing protein [uncultured Methanomethylovorans sp.]
MNGLKRIVYVFFVTFLLLNVAGCIQSKGTVMNEDDAIDQVSEQDLQTSEGRSDMAIQKEMTVTLVSEAVELMGEEGELAFDRFRENGSKWFHNDTYLSIWTIEGKRVVYAPNTSIEGMDASNLKDYDGNPIGEYFINTAMSEEGEGWVSYQWPKPGESVPTMKYTFVKKASIGDQTYLVTSGFYVDDYVYTKDLKKIEHFTRFNSVSLGNVLHPAIVERDLGVNYSIAHVIIIPGASIGDHLMKNPEVHFVLTGKGIFYIEDVPFELSEGQMVLVPANAKQQIVNNGDIALEFLSIDQPAWAQDNEVSLE